MRRKKTDQLVFFQTDKSGKLFVYTVDNFSSKMSDHLEVGNEVSAEFVLRVERFCNARSKTQARVLRICKKWGHAVRVKEALRPVCGARISNYMTQIIAPCIDAVRYSGLLESTKDLQSSLKSLILCFLRKSECG